MRKSKIVMPLLVAGLAMAVGCAKPPQAAIDTARASLQAARDAGAADYAQAALREAENAFSALDAEVAAQAKKFALMRSYKQTATLVASAQAAAEKAATDAVAGKERTKGEAEALLGQARTAMDEANAMLATAPAGKGSQMEIEAMKNDMQGVATSIAEGEQAHAAGRFLESKAKFEAALNAANNVKMMVEQAKAMKAGKKAS
jgi:hypothetical protein